MPNITITPDMFVNPPFIECPQCNKLEYGVLMVNKDNYCRRCNNCMHSGNYPLPSLQKKVIYLDQLVISNMMNSIRPKSVKKDSLSKWKLLFEKLDRLVKLQLIICPYSPVHEEESVVTSVFNDLKKMYSHLSNGTSFYSSDEILRFQLHVAFMKWLGQKVEEINVNDITHGDLYGWQNRIRISVNLNLNNEKDYVREVKNYKNLLHWGLNNIFEVWKKNPDKDFKFWFKHERNSFGKTYWDSYLQLVMKDETSSLLSIFNQQLITIIHMSDVLRSKGIKDEKEIIYKLTDFFESEFVKDTPYVKLFSMLDATMANQAAKGGKKHPPDQGTHNDLTVISTYTPYCDALFIDNPFRETVKQSEKHLKLGIYEKFYSQNNFDGFLKYLDQIESEAPKDILKKVCEVYGEDWGKPYTTMYKKKK